MSQFFIAGILASVNPCGFILLPTYLMYYLGLDPAGESSQRASIRRALWVAGSMSLGFMAVFIVVATITNSFTGWLLENAKYATAFFGVALIALGIAMLFGKKLTFATPQINTGERDQTFRSMFIYGVAYALASISCTLPLFLGAVFAQGESRGVWTGVTNGIAYSAGMTLIVGGLTVALAFARTGMLKFLRRAMQYMDKIVAVFVLVAGMYLLWFFYWFDIREEGDPITDWVQERQGDVATWLNNHQWGVAVFLFVAVGAAVAYVYVRRLSVLVATIVIGLALGVGLTGSWKGPLIVAAAVAIGGAFGLRDQERSADKDADADVAMAG